MTDTPLDGLSRRERQVMKAVFAEGGGLGAEEIRKCLPDPPTNAATRSVLRGLVEKGRLRVEREGRSYRYHAVQAAGSSRRQALSETIRTFFGGSVTDAAAALVEMRGEIGTKEDEDVLKALETVLARQEESK